MPSTNPDLMRMGVEAVEDEGGGADGSKTGLWGLLMLAMLAVVPPPDSGLHGIMLPPPPPLPPPVEVEGLVHVPA